MIKSKQEKKIDFYAMLILLSVKAEIWFLILGNTPYFPNHLLKVWPIIFFHRLFFILVNSWLLVCSYSNSSIPITLFVFLIKNESNNGFGEWFHEWFLFRDGLQGGRFWVK